MSDAIGQPRERAAAVLLHRRLADHEGPGIQGARHGVVVAGAGHRATAHPGKGRSHRTAVGKPQNTAANQTASGVGSCPGRWCAGA